MKKSTLVTLACFVFAMLGILGFVSQAFAANSMDGCTKECSACEKACEKSSAYLKTKSGTAAVETQKKLADCIDMCRTSHAFLQRDSKLHPQVCKVCAEVCKECAKACEAMKDPELKDCITECNKCADSCSKMAS